MGLGSFVNINIFVTKNYFIHFVYIFFLSNLLNQNVKAPKKKTIGSFVQRYLISAQAVHYGDQYFWSKILFDE